MADNLQTVQPSNLLVSLKREDLPHGLYGNAFVLLFMRYNVPVSCEYLKSNP